MKIFVERDFGEIPARWNFLLELHIVASSSKISVKSQRKTRKNYPANFKECNLSFIKIKNEKKSIKISTKTEETDLKCGRIF